MNLSKSVSPGYLGPAWMVDTTARLNELSEECLSNHAASDQPCRARPAGVTLDAPGVLTIRFASSEELLGVVLALAEDAAENYESFAARLARDTVRDPGEGREEAAP